MYPFRRNFLGQNDPFNSNMMGQNYGAYSFENPLENNEEDPYDQLTRQYEQNKVENIAPRSQAIDFPTAYRELMNRQDGPSMSAYRKFVQTGAPREEDYRPTKLGRLGAMLSGMAAAYNNPAAGLETVQRQLERPYRKALEKHESRGSYLREAANLENASVAKQLQIMNSMREMENQRIDNERAMKSLELQIKQGNLSMQESLIRLATAGKRYETDKQTGILYAIDELTGNRRAMGKYDLSTGEQIQKSADTARRSAEATDPIMRNRQQALQASGFENSAELQRRSFENDALGGRQSVNQKEIINQTAVDALVRTDPNKYKNVYIRDPKQDNAYVINNPLQDRGVGIKNGVAIDGKGVPLSEEEIKEYNAFVELHNARIKGIDDTKMLSPLPGISSRYERLPKKQSSIGQYGMTGYTG